MTERRDNSGALFKNDRKEKDTHPDYQGNCTINGVEYYMDAWLKQGQNGKFMSFSFKPKAQTIAARRNEDPVIREDTDDRIPF